MGLFNNLFKKKEENTESTTNQPNNTIHFASENDFLEKFGAIALEKQRNLFEITGGLSWNVDMNKEEITFGDDLTFPMQVLGSFSHSSETWLWIWDNKAGGYAESVMKQALLLKKYGEENNIDLLTVGKFDATQNDLHLIGMIAVEMFNASGYYLGNYGQGTMVVTIKSDAVDNVESEELARILTVFPELISTFEIQNHKNAFTNYLSQKGYELTSNGNEIKAEKNGNVINAVFNDDNLLIKLNGNS
ncbi:MULTISPECIES: DUF6882 domain-containing protein [unclassified Flavobacterium]|uniref:DUF6882 domain-containing protein n=1 Tax=unclassified Flavobacterium TaxID=196869 RepID=UPI0010665BD0|nr:MULTISPECIES: DUF6882 domain-containing protein [unclassified Flavobacterium]TDX11749.1 hypothetical protein EDB96_2541 [Flavobacterium sp. S87F.05.LMB.W.Kidney.N]BDU25682.1 hypothetical protein FLGSB24_24260 [Flavobacterium sp. GSB-24]